MFKLSSPASEHAALHLKLDSITLATMKAALGETVHSVKVVCSLGGEQLPCLTSSSTQGA